MDHTRAAKTVYKFLVKEYAEIKDFFVDLHRLEKDVGLGKHNYYEQDTYTYHTRDVFLEKLTKDQLRIAHIEKKLTRWIARLEDVLAREERKLLPNEKVQVEEVRSRLEVCRINIVRMLAKGGTIDTFVKKGANSQDDAHYFEDALGTEEHPGIRQLIVLLQELGAVGEDDSAKNAHTKIIDI